MIDLLKKEAWDHSVLKNECGVTFYAEPMASVGDFVKEEKQISQISVEPTISGATTIYMQTESSLPMEFQVANSVPESINSVIESEKELPCKILKHPTIVFNEQKKNWIEIPELSDCFEQKNDCGIITCKVCRKDLKSDMVDIVKHVASSKHKKFLHLQRNKNVGYNIKQNLFDLKTDVHCPQAKVLEEISRTKSSAEELPTINELMQKISVALGKESAVFVPSCKSANILAVLTHCKDSKDTCIVGRNSRIRKARMTWLVQMKTYEDLPLDGGLKEMVYQFKSSCHKPSLICIENAHEDAGGMPLSMDWIKKVWNIAQEYNCQVHLDGMKLSDASIATNTPMDEYSNYCDSITFDFGGPVGGALAASKQFIDRVKQCPQFVDLPAKEFLSVGCHMKYSQLFADRARAQAYAKMIASAVAFSNCEYVRASVENTHTNVVMLTCHGIQAEDLIERLEIISQDDPSKIFPSIVMASTSQTSNEESNKVKLVTSSHLSQQDVKTVIDKLKYILCQLQEHV